MRRAITGATAALTLTLALGLTSAALASPTKTRHVTVTTRHVTMTFLGAPVSSTEAVYDVRGPGFRGAAIQIVKNNKAGTAGTATTTVYDGYGTNVSADSYKVTKGKNGVAKITGSGHFVGGTARYAHISGHYTFTGTENTKTFIIKVTSTGTEAY